MTTGLGVCLVSSQLLIGCRRCLTLFFPLLLYYSIYLTFCSFESDSILQNGTSSAKDDNSDYYHHQSAAASLPPKEEGFVKSCEETEVLFVAQWPDSFLRSLPIKSSKSVSPSERSVVSRLNLEEDQTELFFPFENQNLHFPVSELRLVVSNSKTLPLWRTATTSIQPDYDYLHPSVFSSNIPSRKGSSTYVLPPVDDPHIGNDTGNVSNDNGIYWGHQAAVMAAGDPPGTTQLVVDPLITPASVFKLLAPIVGFRQLFASMLLLPVITVQQIKVDQGLQISWKLSPGEGTTFNHTHTDPHHRVIADLDIQYRKCELIDPPIHGNKNLHVQVTLGLGNCPPIQFGWMVKCSNQLNLQEIPRGFHVSDSYTPSSPGRIVSDGIVSPNWADVQHAQTTIPDSHGVTELFVWCKYCAEWNPPTGALDLVFPSLASDTEVVSPSFHLLSSHEKGQEKNSVLFGRVFPSASSFDEGHDLIRLKDDNAPLHFTITYNCHKEGRSIVVVEFVFHSYRSIQFAFHKECKAATAGSDPGCRQGVLSSDRAVCCTKSCGQCGGVLCHRREGGSRNCCEAMIKLLENSSTCSSSLPPCIMSPKEVATADGLGEWINNISDIDNLKNRLNSKNILTGTSVEIASTNNNTSGVKNQPYNPSLIDSYNPLFSSPPRNPSNSSPSSNVYVHSSYTNDRGEKMASSSAKQFVLVVGLFSAFSLVVSVVYQKHARGHRGADLLPRPVEIATAAVRLPVVIGRIAGPLLRAISKRVGRPGVLVRRPGAYEPVGQNHLAVNLGKFVFEDEQEDELTGTSMVIHRYSYSKEGEQLHGEKNFQRTTNGISSKPPSVPPGFWPPITTSSADKTRREPAEESPPSSSNNAFPYGSI